jgi:hypothetical protein
VKIEVERFLDNRLKMKKTYSLRDSNIRRIGNDVDIVPKLDEVELEKDVLEAVNLWNLMYRFPDLNREIRQVLKRYFHKT